MGPDEWEEWDRRMEEMWENEINGMDDCVYDAVMPSLDGTLLYRTGEVIELLCSRRLTFLDLEEYGINIISEGKYR
jgi:hypothetical protein